MTDTTAREAPWIPSAGLVSGLVVGILLIGGGLVFSRAQLILIAAPILVSVVWAYQRRPRNESSVRVRTTIGAKTTSAAVDYSIEMSVSADTDAVIVRLYERGLDRSQFVVDAATAAHLSGQIEIVHSGPQELLRVDYSLVGPQGGVTTGPAAGPRSSRVIPPRILPLRRLPLPFRMFGLSGGHDSARPGEGGEFRDIGQFAPGDRLRRIDWKVTARRGQSPSDLYVRRSFSTADATVLVVMDSRDEVSELVSNRLSRTLKFDSVTSLDLAREAASSIASAYLGAGDRVGFRDLARGARILAPGGGAAQLHRLLPAIAQTRPVGAPQRRIRAPLIPAGSLVYLLSTFLDGEAARFAELWRVAGHRVVVIDTLPPTTTQGLRRDQQDAMRIVQLERETRIRSLAALGVDIIRWNSPVGQSPESQLATRSRVSMRPR